MAGAKASLLVFTSQRLDPLGFSYQLLESEKPDLRSHPSWHSKGYVYNLLIIITYNN